MAALSLRVNRLRALADARDWEYTARDDDWARRTGAPFLPGGRARHVLRGGWGGRDLAAFELTTRVRAVSAAGAPVPVLQRWSVVLVALPADLPGLELRPGPAGRLQAALPWGRWPRHVPRSEAVARRYGVRAQDPAAAAGLLGPRAVAVLLERAPLAVRLAGREAVAWVPGRLTAARLVQAADTLSALVDAVPPWSWSRQRPERVASSSPERRAR